MTHFDLIHIFDILCRIKLKIISVIPYFVYMP